MARLLRADGGGTRVLGTPSAVLRFAWLPALCGEELAAEWQTHTWPSGCDARSNAGISGESGLQFVVRAR